MASILNTVKQVSSDFLYNAVSDLIVFFLLSKAKGFTDALRCDAAHVSWEDEGDITHILHKL